MICRNLCGVWCEVSASCGDSRSWLHTSASCKQHRFQHLRCLNFVWDCKKSHWQLYWSVLPLLVTWGPWWRHQETWRRWWRGWSRARWARRPARGGTPDNQSEMSTGSRDQGPCSHWPSHSPPWGRAPGGRRGWWRGPTQPPRLSLTTDTEISVLVSFTSAVLINRQKPKTDTLALALSTDQFKIKI